MHPLCQIKMSFLKVVNALTKLSTASFLPRRSISEYSKRFGYKLKEPTGEVEVSYGKNLFYILGSCLLLLDLARDKQQHYETFIKHFDESKNYFEPDFHPTMVSVPNMDFLMKDKEPHHLGDGKAPETFELYGKYSGGVN